MSDEEIEKKCAGLMAPILGEARMKKLIDRVWNIEKIRNMRELRPLLAAP